MTGRLAFLEARDARQLALSRLLEEGVAPGSVLMLGTNVPGARKHRPGLAALLQGAVARLGPAIGLELRVSGRDLLGPYHLGVAAAAPEAAKRAALALEAGHPGARLLDVDVYQPDGSQLDRAGLGLPPRPCLACGEPAQECIRLRRHGIPELLERVDALLGPWRAEPGPVRPAALAGTLARGALRELELTPKPGLVDAHDSGSHPDLSFAAMRTSAGLLPLFYADLLACAAEEQLDPFVRAGIEAERRMTQAIRSNAHKGYIFLSGLALMAACRCDGQVPALRREFAAGARAFFARFDPGPSHGAELRARLGLGGIQAEASLGLPAVFEHGWPHYREALAAGWDPRHAGCYLMAVLMQQVEDTTAVRRCGLEGLARLKRDGAALQRLLEQGREPEPWLAALNEDYRRIRLTMGGVADCMALTFALEEAATIGLD
jgi:triphosphoribosyl-dephospho-CoA synthase